MEENRAALQELYKELDTNREGDRNLILYAQYRALGYDHKEAIVRRRTLRRATSINLF